MEKLFQDFGLIELNDNNKGNISVILWNKIFNLDLIRKYKISFPNGFESDDNAFIYQYLCIAKKCFGLNKNLYNYRLLENSIMGKLLSHQSYHKLFDIINVFAFTLNFMKINNFDNKWILKIILNQTNWALGLLNKNDKLLFFKKINEIVLIFFSEIDLTNFPILLFCKKQQYKKALEIISQIKRINFLGVTLYKSKKKENIISYYILGIKLYSKQIGSDAKSN